MRDQIEPLLVGKARNNSNYRALQVLRLIRGQLKSIQQIFLADLLAVEILRRIILGDQSVDVRAPDRVVYSIQYPYQPVRALHDHAFQARAIFRRLNFSRVAAAHRRKVISEKQPAL